MQKTTVAISKDVIEELKKIGKMGESYDKVIMKLVNYYNTKPSWKND